jgi:hypothetical protein
MREPGNHLRMGRHPSDCQLSPFREVPLIPMGGTFRICGLTLNPNGLRSLRCWRDSCASRLHSAQPQGTSDDRRATHGGMGLPRRQR